MRSTWHPASDALAGVLAGTWSVHAADGADLAARVLPDGTSCLVFQREGTTLRSRDGDWRPWSATCVSGPRSGPFDFTLGAGGRILIVQLHAAGAMPALGVPMSSLADRFEPLDLVVGAASREIGDGMASDRDDRACVRTIERWLLRRVRAHGRACAVTDAAIREVARSAGRLRVDDLAEHVGLSRRHLARILHERVGYTPKLLARITRFDHAVKQGRACPTAPWARIALDAGYADQAHMAREFAALGGIRPSALRGPGAATIW